MLQGPQAEGCGAAEQSAAPLAHLLGGPLLPLLPLQAAHERALRLMAEPLGSPAVSEQTARALAAAPARAGPVLGWGGGHCRAR